MTPPPDTLTCFLAGTTTNPVVLTNLNSANPFWVFPVGGNNSELMGLARGLGRSGHAARGAGPGSRAATAGRRALVLGGGPGACSSVHPPSSHLPSRLATPAIDPFTPYGEGLGFGFKV